MRTFQCQCGNTLFFASTRCVQCHRETAMCPRCRTVSGTEKQNNGALRCGNPRCQSMIQLCQNRSEHNACNCGVLLDNKSTPLCRFCDLNDIIPDLSVPGNLAKWQVLEAAKHRVLYVAEQMGLPIIGPDVDSEPKLVFDFKADGKHPVSTGHSSGRITINIVEADSAQREKTRVQFAEPQRTLVGHFRHELGHYYWDLLVLPNADRLQGFRDRFGDERSPTYAEAQKRYYAAGPIPQWRTHLISAYASMHPWEDFAETFNVYLDMVTVLMTTNHFKWTDTPIDKFETMLEAYKQIGITANELNRDMGLLDLVPEIFTGPVTEKLAYVHQICINAIQQPLVSIP